MVPQPYTVPTEGPVGRYLEMVGQHPWRPAHIHLKVDAPDHAPLITQVFFPGDPYLDNDTIGAVKAALVRPLAQHDDDRAKSERGLDRPFYTTEFDIRLRPAPPG
jgi:protocatechuate 3,4-dioxygenase beta subunit